MAIDDYTVHIVDDEEAVRKSLAFLLTMSGFTVRMHRVGDRISCHRTDNPQWLPGDRFANARHEWRGIVAQLENGRPSYSLYRYNGAWRRADGRRSHEGRGLGLHRKAI